MKNFLLCMSMLLSIVFISTASSPPEFNKLSYNEVCKPSDSIVVAPITIGCIFSNDIVYEDCAIHRIRTCETSILYTKTLNTQCISLLCDVGKYSELSILLYSTKTLSKSYSNLPCDVGKLSILQISTI